MRILAIETASEACSVALFERDRLVAHDHRVLGRGHAEALVPMIEALPDKGRADRIFVSLGPGSFTGVRIGIATGRALGFAWGAEVLGFPSLALIAAIAVAERGNGASAVTVCVNGGHGQWFVQDFDAAGIAQAPAASLTPDQAASRQCHSIVAGNRAEELAALRLGEDLICIDAVGNASRLNLLSADSFTLVLTPAYGRAPDAVPKAKKPTGSTA